jgi:hypothetical protein
MRRRIVQRIQAPNGYARVSLIERLASAFEVAD